MKKKVWIKSHSTTVTQVARSGKKRGQLVKVKSTVGGHYRRLT